MADSVFHSVASANNYEVSYGPYGQVLMSWAFDVWVTIYETPRTIGNQVSIGNLRCAFPSDGSAIAWYRADAYTGDGAGFWNAAGIMWGNGTFVPQRQSLYLPPYGTDSDSYDAMLAQLNAATSDYFVRFAFVDNVASPNLETWAPVGASFSREIYESELDASGNLPPLVLAKLFSRSYDHDDATGPGSGYPYATVVDLVGEITSQQMNIDWRYYPWARKLSNQWESCNRDYDTPTASRQAYLRRKESGGWQDVLNNLQPSAASDQMAWRKQDGNWEYALPYGNNA